MRDIDPWDIVLWPDNTWCLGESLHEYTHLSDDFEVIKYGTERHNQLSEEADDALRERNQRPD